MQTSKTVTVSEPAGAAPSFALTLTLHVDLVEMRALTGLHYPGDIAAWLASQIELLDDMLTDGDARDALLRYLGSYAEQDRDAGTLPTEVAP